VRELLGVFGPVGFLGRAGNPDTLSETGLRLSSQLWSECQESRVMEATFPAVIDTERLVLRPFSLSDVDDVFAYAKDPEWSRFLRALPRPYLRSDAEQFIARQILLDPSERPVWAVVLDDTVIGGIGLRVRTRHRLAELGYSIARAHWGQGYGTEAAHAVIDAAFRANPDLNRIHARADSQNEASQRVMVKVGMTKEGIFRLSRVERGEAFDEAWYAILRHEWAG
jgi:ribosomal-protein-alanine N-acetyltransferase